MKVERLPDEIVPPIDWAVLERLQTLLKDGFLPALQLAMGNTQSHIHHIRDGLDDKDVAKARQYAHKIVSSAGPFGLQNVVQKAQKIEYGDAESNDFNEFQRDLHQSLQDAIHQLRTQNLLS
jgi:HPt (histidine-containing phosphotransfer) domain-containing protein